MAQFNANCYGYTVLLSNSDRVYVLVVKVK